MPDEISAAANAAPHGVVGRPTKYNPILAERICELIAQGNSKRAIARMKGMPSVPAIDAWLQKHDGFASQYARACELRAEGYAEEIVAIADDPKLPADQKRVMVDARKWVACKLLPRKYGDSVTLKGDRDNPLAIQRVDLSDSSLMAIAAGEAVLDG